MRSVRKRRRDPLSIFSSLLLFFLTPHPTPPLLTPAMQATQILIIRFVNVKPLDISLPQNDVKKKKNDRKVSQKSAISLEYD